jgi:DNA repair protein RecN (Recombination protein N)
LDIHGQHEQQTLLDSSSQLALIDAFADANDLAAEVRQLDDAIRKTEEELLSLLSDHARKRSAWICSSSSAMKFRKSIRSRGDEAAQQQLAILSHATRLLEAANRGYEQLYDSDTSVSSIWRRRVEPCAMSRNTTRVSSPGDPNRIPRIQIQEIASGLRDYAARIEADPKELERIQSRLAELERLHRKYGPDLLAHLDKVTREMDSMGLTEHQKDTLMQRVAALRVDYDKAARALSRKRRAASESSRSMWSRTEVPCHAPRSISRSWTDVIPGRAQASIARSSSSPQIQEKIFVRWQKSLRAGTVSRHARLANGAGRG